MRPSSSVYKYNNFFEENHQSSHHPPHGYLTQRDFIKEED
jgi:uncharacterized short protein YbdD (DUF466 family)